MIIGNKFSKDDDSVRTERLQYLAANVEELAPELGLSDDVLTWARGAYDRWYEALLTANAEGAETEGAYVGLELAVEPAVKYYAAVRKLLMSIIERHGEDREIVEAYGFKGKSPRRYKKLVPAIDLWKETHDKLVAAGDPRVVNETIIAKLVAHRNEVNDAWRKALEEKREAAEAYETKREIFDEDCDMLRFLFNLCKLTWGDDDPKLILLGFVQKSGVWTFKKKNEDENT